MDMSNKSRIIDVIFTLLGLTIFLVILWFLAQNNPAVKELLRFQTFSGLINNLIPKIIVSIILFFIFKLLYTFVVDIMVSKLRKILVSRLRFMTIKKLIRFFWWVIYSFIIISIFTGDIKTVFTSLGLIGLGLTFALQKPILNFVGWLTIILKNIYNEGDRIEMGNIRGDVKEIQLMNTVLYGLLENSNVRSYKIITVPNELVLTTDVENYTKDSNYIMEELSISITYESNYHKAMKLLEEIVTKHLRDNIKSYIKWRERERGNITKFLRNFTDKRRKNSVVVEAENKEEKIKNELQKIEDLEEEFKPRVRVELADSSVLLILQFLTPYDQVKANRTKIIIAFLDAIAKEKDIEVAYPHMELIYDKKK